MKTNRRELLKKGFLSSTALLGISQIARAGTGQCSELKTPRQTEGPFYPVADQVDKDADLIIVQGKSEIAQGQIVIVQGILTDQHCIPVAGALVEIWQACKTGRYNHPSDPNPAPLDPNFQYWGKAMTNENGLYRFRTIIPGAYQAAADWVRPPHIHFKVSKRGFMELITQMYFAGETLNSTDKILQRTPKGEQHKLIVQFNNQHGMQHPTGQFNIQIERI